MIFFVIGLVFIIALAVIVAWGLSEISNDPFSS